MAPKHGDNPVIVKSRVWRTPSKAVDLVLALLTSITIALCIDSIGTAAQDVLFKAYLHCDYPYDCSGLGVATQLAYPVITTFGKWLCGFSGIPWIALLIGTIRGWGGRDVESVLLNGHMYELVKSAYRTKVMAVAMALRYVVYLGVHATVRLPKNDPVKHPVSYFTQALFQTFSPNRAAVAFSTYKRVNPTAEFKVEAVKKFDIPQLLPDDALVSEFISLAREYCPWSNGDFVADLNGFLDNMLDFDDIEFDGSSAAGYPYPAGTKRRDAASDAKAKAVDLLRDLAQSSDKAKVLKEFVHYATGRAKLVGVDDSDSCRLVVYQAFATFLIMHKYAQPFTRHFVSSRPSWSGIGFSWFSRGACALAAILGLVKGFSPDGHLVCSSDVSNWDASLSRAFLYGVCEFHCEVLRNSCPKGTADVWIPIIRAMYEHMIHAEVVLPGGHTFRMPGGMKSGWNLTSIDNTIIHEVIFRRASIAACGRIVTHVLYGDDNIFVVPLSFDFAKFATVYTELGVKLKYVHTSRESKDIDFLSKYLRYNKEYDFYYPWRPTIESDARMLMPEDFDPLLMPASDAVASAEVIVGHLFDNFFNMEVRSLCLTMLQHIRTTYNVREVDVTRAIRTFKYRGMDIGFRATLPTVPNVSMIAARYGAPDGIDTFLDDVEATVSPKVFDPFARTRNDVAATIAEAFSMRVNLLMRTLSRRSVGRITWFTRPFQISYWSAGTAGLKFLEGIKSLGYGTTRKLKTLLDVGGHPGSVCRTINAASPDVIVTTVSPMYQQDIQEGREFMYKTVCRPQDTRIKKRFEETHLTQYFDHAHVDVTYEDLDDAVKYGSVAHATKYVERIMPIVERVTHIADTATIVLPSLVEPFPMVIHRLKERGSINMLKPIFSHPWNTEVLVTFERGHPTPARLSVVREMTRAFRIALAERLIKWSTARLLNFHRFMDGADLVQFNHAGDTKYQREMITKVLPATYSGPTSEL